MKPTVTSCCCAALVRSLLCHLLLMAPLQASAAPACGGDDAPASAASAVAALQGYPGSVCLHILWAYSVTCSDARSSTCRSGLLQRHATRSQRSCPAGQAHCRQQPAALDKLSWRWCHAALTTRLASCTGLAYEGPVPAACCCTSDCDQHC
jgi:hypothetical protein